ncbi:hypothetical protein LXL04_008009 [Taraxacum kok-saghyz]
MAVIFSLHRLEGVETPFINPTPTTFLLRLGVLIRHNPSSTYIQSLSSCLVANVCFRFSFELRVVCNKCKVKSKKPQFGSYSNLRSIQEKNKHEFVKSKTTDNKKNHLMKQHKNNIGFSICNFVLKIFYSFMLDFKLISKFCFSVNPCSTRVLQLSRSFENSYIPENPRTPKPLTFSKNRLRGAKNRSNIISAWKWGGEGAGSVIPVPVPEFLTLSPSPSPSPTDAGNQISSPLDFKFFPDPSPVHPQPIPDPQT